MFSKRRFFTNILKKSALKPVSFLGYSLSFRRTSKNSQKKTNVLFFKKVIVFKVKFSAVILKLHAAKFCNKQGKPLPCFQMLHQTLRLTLQKINFLLLGFYNHFKVGNNFKRSFLQFKYILQHSTAKMFAAKFKLKTRATVFKKICLKSRNSSFLT